LPLTEELKSVARRIIWFEEPEQALSDAVRFLVYAMAYAQHEDMTTIRRYVTDDELRVALEQAPPGIIDARSWSYWHVKLDRYPAPPMPTRRL